MKGCNALQKAIQHRATAVTAARLPARRAICSSAPLATSAHDDTPGSHSRTSAIEPGEGHTNSKSSAAAFIAAQAAAEEAHEAEVFRSGQAKRPRVVPDPDAWRGEESRERMLRRILEDQYKPLRVKVSFRIPSPLSHRPSAFRHVKSVLTRYTSMARGRAGLPEADPAARTAPFAGIRDGRADYYFDYTIHGYRISPSAKPLGCRLQTARALQPVARLQSDGSERDRHDLGSKGCDRRSAKGRLVLEPSVGIQEAASRERIRAVSGLPRWRATPFRQRPQRARVRWRIRPHERTRGFRPRARAAERPKRWRAGAGFPSLGRLVGGKDQAGAKGRRL